MTSMASFIWCITLFVIKMVEFKNLLVLEYLENGPHTDYEFSNVVETTLIQISYKNDSHVSLVTHR